MENTKLYIGYDYKEVTVSKKFELAWKDSYTNLGWEIEKIQPAIEKHAWGPLRVMAAPLAILPGHIFKNMVQDHESASKVVLNMKRNRTIQNKNELNRLQVSLETTLNEMEYLQKAKTFEASIAAYIIGLFGTIFMAFAMFSYLASNLIGCVGFAIPAFIGWIVSYATYIVIKNKKETEINKEIDAKFDTINDICMQAHEYANCE